MPYDDEDQISTDSAPKKRTKRETEALLKEIRDRFTYAADEWKDTFDEGRIDMRYISGDPWDPDEKAERKDAGRPCIALDELNQYINQVNNDIRQNKRAIQLKPKGNGANDKTAEFWQNLIRGIEYESNAQTAYSTMFENALQRSFGSLRLMTEYVSDESFDQRICIKRIPNPETVLFDPDTKEADFSDAEYCFVTDQIPKKEFKRRFPKATITSFTREHMATAGRWVQENSVQVAEYWKVEKTPRTIYQLADGSIVEKLEAGQKAVKDREIYDRKVCQYITNGLEILEENAWAGRWIPIIMMTGKEMYISDDGGSKRVFVSLIRLARDPYMLYCYLATQEAEEAGMTPKTPYEGYVGQFETDKETWETINKIPHAYVQADPIVDGATNQVLPLPIRQPFQPNFQAYEVAKEAAKRAIQSALGMYNASVGKHDTKANSGKAIEQLDQQSDRGSFHFIDNYDRTLKFLGDQIMNLGPKVMDTAREVSLAKADGQTEVVRINDPNFVNPKTKQKEHYPTDVGDHNVTISTGPSYESQRDEVEDFGKVLVANIQNLPIPPEAKAKLLALIIKLKNIGPLGDQMAELLSPSQDGEIPPQAQAMIQQVQQQVQALNAACQHYEQQIQKLEFEKQAKVLDNEQKLKIATMEIEAKVAMAEITTKAQNVSERMTFVEDMIKQLMGQRHQAELQTGSQAHEAALSAQNAANADRQQATDIAAQQQQADAQQPAQ